MSEALGGPSWRRYLLSPARRGYSTRQRGRPRASPAPGGAGYTQVAGRARRGPAGADGAGCPRPMRFPKRL